MVALAEALANYLKRFCARTAGVAVFNTAGRTVEDRRFSAVLGQETELGL